MIVCVGLATRDAIYSLPEFPTRDGRVIATERVVAGGGPAATAAVAAAKLGADVRFVGVLEDDLPGVDTIRMPGRLVESTILVTGAERAIVTQPWTPFECPPDALAGADWVHVDHVGYQALQTVCASNGLRLSVDGGFPIPGLDLDRIELYAPPQDLDDGRRASVTVVTRGSAGCTVYVRGGAPYAVPAPPVDGLVSTLGAGDVFHGALLAALERGLELRDACEKANAAAALSCRALDGRSGSPTWDEL